MYIGITDQQSLPQETSNLGVWYHQGLFTNHLYFNLRSKAMRDIEFRRDFGAVVKHFSRLYPANIGSLAETRSFLPLGLASPAYYNGKLESEVSLKQFVGRWKGKIASRKLRILSCFNELGPKAVQELKVFFRSLGSDFEFIFDADGPYYEQIDSGEFDAIFIAGSALFERADSFVGYPLDRLARIDKLFEQRFALHRREIIAAIDESGSDRTNRISKAFLDLEKEYLFLPFYQYRAPIVYGKRVLIPNEMYRYFFSFKLVKFREGAN